MLTFRNYVKAESLDQAWELNQKKSSVIIGGMLWLKMENRTVNTVIDLSGLGLDGIEETEEEFRIGCMTTLRTIETHCGLNDYTHGACREAVRHIIGVQFRNLATVGGSIFGRFGFSDVLTFFLAMDTEVELYKGGRISLQEFSRMRPDRDVLVRLIVKKKPLRIDYRTIRNARTDFPVLACAMSCVDGEYRAVVGARPGRAVLHRDETGMTVQDPAQFIQLVQQNTVTGSNTRAGAEYRKDMIQVLLNRCYQAIDKQEVAE